MAVSKTFPLVIAAAGVLFSISPQNLPIGVVGQPYSCLLSVTGGGGATPVLVGFPTDHILNTSILKAPLLANSVAMIASINTAAIAANRGPVHPGFEIPVNVGVFPVTNIIFDGAAESDPGPYPFPPNPSIEPGGDGHMLVIASDTNRLYEVFGFRPGPPAAGGSGAMWDMNGYALRPLWWTSADGAGLPIAPLLIRFSEFSKGAILHALRVTMQTTRNFGNYLDPSKAYPADWPARHRGNTTLADPNVPAMGTRLRLKSTFDDSGLSAESRIITTCMKTFGLIVADNGSAMFLQGDTDSGWTAALIDKLTTELRNVKVADFEAVDGVTPYMISADSGQARQL